MAQHGNKIGNVGPTWLNMGPMRPNIGPTCALQRANIEHVVLFIGTLELTANTPVRAVVVAKPPEYLSFKSGHSGPESKLRQASDANETSRAFQLIPPVKNKMQKGKTVRHFMLIECLISSSATLQLWPLQGLMSCELSLNQSKNSRCQAARYCKTSGCSCWHSRMDLSCLGNGSGKQHNSTMHVMNESRNVKNAKTVYGNSLCSFTTRARLAGAFATSKIIKTWVLRSTVSQSVVSMYLINPYNLYYISSLFNILTIQSKLWRPLKFWTDTFLLGSTRDGNRKPSIHSLRSGRPGTISEYIGFIESVGICWDLLGSIESLLASGCSHRHPGRRSALQWPLYRMLPPTDSVTKSASRHVICPTSMISWWGSCG